MVIIRVIFLVLVLCTPIGLTSIITFGDDKETCELLENFGEEEGDDREIETAKNLDFFHHSFFGFQLDNTNSQQKLAAYKKDSPCILNLARKVQTPPPEL